MLSANYNAAVRWMPGRQRSSHFTRKSTRLLMLSSSRLQIPHWRRPSTRTLHQQLAVNTEKTRSNRLLGPERTSRRNLFVGTLTETGSRHFGFVSNCSFDPLCVISSFLSQPTSPTLVCQMARRVMVPGTPTTSQKATSIPSIVSS